MTLSRRALLAIPLLGARAAPASAAEVATLRPGSRSVIGITRLPDQRLAFRASGLGPAITLPATQAGHATLLPIADRQIVLLVFTIASVAPARLDLGAFVGWDGARLRVLALEALLWRTPDGGGFSTRARASGDRTRLLLLRDAGAPRGARPWMRESWTDMLAWRGGGSLADAPARVPPPGTWQARLAALRARVAARLEEPRAAITDDLVALFTPGALPPP